MKHNQEFAVPPTAKRPRTAAEDHNEEDDDNYGECTTTENSVQQQQQQQQRRRRDWCMPYLAPTLLDSFRLSLVRVGRDLAPGSVVDGCRCRFLAVVLRKRTAGRALAFADTDFVPLWTLKNMPFIIPSGSSLRASLGGVASIKKPSQKQQQQQQQQNDAVPAPPISKRAQKRANAQRKLAGKSANSPFSSATPNPIQASTTPNEDLPANIPDILKVQLMFERTRWERRAEEMYPAVSERQFHGWGTVALCEAGSLVLCSGLLGRSAAGAATVNVDEAELVRVAPNPESIARLVNAYTSGIVSAAQASRALSCAHNQNVLTRLARVVTGGGPAGLRHKTLAYCARRLRGCTSLQRNRTRPPRISERDLNVLRAVEERPECARWRPNVPTLGGAAAELRPRNAEEAHAIAEIERRLKSGGGGGNTSNNNNNNKSIIDPLKNIPEDADWRRLHYALAKKSPQVDWMTARILYVLDKSCSALGRPRTVVDVGGGRGDLALAVAAALDSSSNGGGHVTVVDANLESLAAGEQRAKAEGLQERMTFIGDRIENVPKFDFSLVIGLHACGGLGEYALKLAAVHGASFVLCTCCFNSNPAMAVLTRVCDDNDPPLPLHEVKTLCGLAEKVTEPPSISRRAMHAMNALRLAQIYKIFNKYNPDKSLDLFQAMYPEKYSRANCVLIGIVTPKK